MSLELQINICGPNDNDISNALGMIQGRSDWAWFMLQRGESAYMQTDGVELEYQEGNLYYHYRCSIPLSLADIERAFQSYARGDDWWKETIPWEHMPL
jgi:hypothetical protein